MTQIKSSNLESLFTYRARVQRGEEGQAGETLDQEAPLSRYEETEFYVARQNSRRARGSEPQVPKQASGDANFVSTTKPFCTPLTV